MRRTKEPSKVTKHGNCRNVAYVDVGADGVVGAPDRVASASAVTLVGRPTLGRNRAGVGGPLHARPSRAHSARAQIALWVNILGKEGGGGGETRKH